jgi:hypothetical protein
MLPAEWRRPNVEFLGVGNAREQEHTSASMDAQHASSVSLYMR